MRSCRSKRRAPRKTGVVIVEARGEPASQRRRARRRYAPRRNRSSAGRRIRAPRDRRARDARRHGGSGLSAARSSRCSRAATSSSTPMRRRRPVEIRDSNRYAIAASLRAMGAQARHYPTLRDEDVGVRIGARDGDWRSATRVVVTRRLVGRRSRSLAARRRNDRATRRRRSRTAREAGKADALWRRRRQADSRVAGQSDVGAAHARSGRRADRRRARRCARRRADASGAPRGAGSQPCRMDVVRSGRAAG